MNRRCHKEFCSDPNLSHVIIKDVSFESGVLDEAFEHALENEVLWGEFGSCTFIKYCIPFVAMINCLIQACYISLFSKGHCNQKGSCKSFKKHTLVKSNFANIRNWF